jgi:hypothetical protein
MPTHEEGARFLGEWQRLSPEQQVLFMAAVIELVEDLTERGHLRSSLQIKETAGHPGIYELSWARDGRATFQYGAERRPGERHLIWRRVGRPEILNDP